MTHYRRALIGVTETSGQVHYIKVRLQSDEHAVGRLLRRWVRRESDAHALIALGNMRMEETGGGGRLVREDGWNESTPRDGARCDPGTWPEGDNGASIAEHHELFTDVTAANMADAVVLLEDGEWHCWRIFPGNSREILSDAVAALETAERLIERAIRKYEAVREAAPARRTRLRAAARDDIKTSYDALKRRLNRNLVPCGWWAGVTLDFDEYSFADATFRRALDTRVASEQALKEMQPTLQRVAATRDRARKLLAALDENEGAELWGHWPVGTEPQAEAQAIA